MSKDIKEYLRYYYGQECVITAPDGIKYSTPDRINEYWIDRVSCQGGAIQPILRKLESMKEEDVKGFASAYGLKDFTIVKGNCHGNFIQMEYLQKGAGYTDYIHWYVHQLKAEQFHYLLSRGFWLFGNDWFDEGLIIDKETGKAGD